MPSTFTWLDYSEHERRQMLDVIDLFGERTTRDELGLGGVRDTFADLFFPGTSTIQTRAKYFILVPWIYLSLEQRHTPSAQVVERARKQELALARALEQSDDAEGVIGRVAKEQLQRLPSSVYWQGLATWGIRLFSGSLDAYHRSLDSFYLRSKAQRASGTEFEGESPHANLQNWHSGLPQLPGEFPAAVSMQLTTVEASYLRERVLTSHPNSLMAFILREGRDISSNRFAWELIEYLPTKLGEQVKHAQNFSELIHGAQLLYNLIIAEQKAWSEKIEVYRDALKTWWQIRLARADGYSQWDQREFWSSVCRLNPRISTRAQNFIQNWINLVLQTSNIETLISGDSARHMVEHRESQLKGSLARTKNARARELWNGAAGAAQLDLRWNSARRIMMDIMNGLGGNRDA